MKSWICLTVVLVHLNSAFGGETCGNAADDLGKSTGRLTLISSPNKKRLDSNNFNSIYEKSDWQEEPTVIYADADPKKTYALLNIDPDPPAYKAGEYYLHWLVSNIKGEDFAKGDLSKANHLQGYYGPAPPEGSGLHRYMFFVFEEKNDKSGEIESPPRRSKFEFLPWLRRQADLCGVVAEIQFRTKF